MASYFDLPQRPKATEPADDEVTGKRSMLTPQVTSILDELGNEHSSSDDELESDSSQEQERKTRIDEPKAPSPLRKASTSPLPQAAKAKLPPPRPGPRHPHLARFHSLRSMLFSTRIEESIAQIQEREAQERAEAKWKEEHKNRLSVTRPKTPPSPKSPTKEGFAHRAVNRLRRLGSKEVNELPTMNENKVFDSNESSEVESPREVASLKDIVENPASDTESLALDHVDELVRWVSRKDTPTHEEAPRGRVKAREFDHADENRSLRNSDVDDLVRHVSRRSEPIEEVEQHSLSDASTASDSEGVGKRRESFGNEDVEDLVRWISRKEGSNAGPVRQIDHKSNPKSEREPMVTSADSDADDSDSDAELTRWMSRKSGSKAMSARRSEHGVASGAAIGIYYDSDHPPELKRWIKRQDSTSGESRAGDGTTTLDTDAEDGLAQDLEDKQVDELVRFATHRDSTSDEIPTDPSGIGKDEITIDDIDDLVRWVSRKQSKDVSRIDSKDTEEDTIKPQQPKEDKQPNVDAERGSLREDDVHDLVRWVTRKDDDKEEATKQEEQRDAVRGKETKALQATPDEKAEAVGMSTEHGSLAPEDVDELVKWVSNRHSNAQESIKIEKEADVIVKDEVEEIETPKSQQEKQSSLDNSHERGSLANEDVGDLVRWISKRESDAQGGAKDEERRDDQILKWNKEENELKENRGQKLNSTKMAADEHEGRKGSLGEEDVNELLQWVSRK